MNRRLWLLMAGFTLTMTSAIAAAGGDISDPLTSMEEVLMGLISSISPLMGGISLTAAAMCFIMMRDTRGISMIVIGVMFISMPTFLEMTMGPVGPTSPEQGKFSIEDEPGIAGGWLLLTIPAAALILAALFRRDIQGLLAHTDSAQEIETVDELRTQAETNAKSSEEAERFAKPLSSTESFASVDIDKRKRKVILD